MLILTGSPNCCVVFKASNSKRGPVFKRVLGAYFMARTMHDSSHRDIQILQIYFLDSISIAEPQLSSSHEAV